MFLIITSIVLTPNWFKFCSIKLENSRDRKEDEMKRLTTHAYYCFSLHTYVFIYRQAVDYLEGQNGAIFPEIFVSVSLKALLLNPFTPIKTEQRLINQCDSWRVRLHGNQISPERRNSESSSPFADIQPSKMINSCRCTLKAFSNHITDVVAAKYTVISKYQLLLLEMLPGFYTNIKIFPD